MIFNELLNELATRQATFEDIEQVARNNTTVARAVSLIRHGVCTREQAMMRAVIYLAAQNHGHLDELARLIRLVPPAPFIAVNTIDPETGEPY